MDSPPVCVVISLLASDERIIGRLVHAFIWLSLGGVGVALALNWSSLAKVLAGVAVISGFALLGSPLLAILYGLALFLVRRAAGTESR
jgi:hypothetical protein